MTSFEPLCSLSAEEQLYVLKKGGNVNGLSFSLWDDPAQSSSSYTPPYKCASRFIPLPCTLIKTPQWPRWSTKTFTRPTKELMHLETCRSNTGSISGHTAPTNLAWGYSATYCYWLFCLCLNFSLPRTFSKIWVYCECEHFWFDYRPWYFS